VASNVLNPKIAEFFLAYLPSDAGPASGGTAPRPLAFGLIFALLILAIFGALALFSGTVGLWVGTWPRFAGGLEWLTGGVLIFLGIRLVL
jgi:threonine/homoserine/homoserine lactone efflux protein